MTTLAALLAELHCPFCGSPLEPESDAPAGGPELRYGILRCSCGRYPVIEGIPIIRYSPSVGPSGIEALIECIDSGNHEGALFHALNSTYPVSIPRSRWQRAVGFATRKRLPLSWLLGRLEGRRFTDVLRDDALTFEKALRHLRPKSYADYLFHRHASVSFLAGVAVLLLLAVLEDEKGSPSEGARTPRVLELSCGAGHSSFLIGRLFPRLSLVSVDHDFVNLYLARRFMIPDVACLCIDAEFPLPFADRSFDGVYCLDSIHYLRSKIALSEEFDRIVGNDGLLLFPHLHNALVDNYTPGVPLSPAAYLRCFDAFQPRLFTEAGILRSFLSDRGLDLTALAAEEDLRRSDALCLIAGRRAGLWRNHVGLASTLSDDRSDLSINPIYSRDEGRPANQLRMAWPSAFAEAEFGALAEYLPEVCKIEEPIWNRLKAGRPEQEDEPSVRRLIETFLLVHLPPRYGSRN